MRLLSLPRVSRHSAARRAPVLASLALAALLLCPLHATPAYSGEDSAVAAPDPGKAPEAAKKPAVNTSNVCDITGVVAKMQSVERSPWTDGTPSALNTTEIDISITVKERKPHYKDAPPGTACSKAASGEVHTYKLCSSTAVKTGDSIQATEGLRTGPANTAGCLFDLVVLQTGNGKI